MWNYSFRLTLSWQSVCVCVCLRLHHCLFSTCSRFHFICLSVHLFCFNNWLKQIIAQENINEWLVTAFDTINTRIEKSLWKAACKNRVAKMTQKRCTKQSNKRTAVANGDIILMLHISVHVATWYGNRRIAQTTI